jgi:CHASE3 domain sensor protein
MNRRGMMHASAAVLLVAAVGTLAFVGREYRKDRNSLQGVYAKTAKWRDITDTSSTAVSALLDAVAQAQGYALTGETVYSEAYAADLRTWQDESGTMELEALHDPATPMVKELLEDGAKVTKETDLVVSLEDKGSHDAALDRIRKGSAIVYLGQARDLVKQIHGLDGVGADETDQRLIGSYLASGRRLALGAAALFCAALAAMLLLVYAVRTNRPAPVGSEPQRAMTAN